MSKYRINESSRAFKTLLPGLLLACAVQASASVTNPRIGALIWSDEFNGTVLDTRIWTPYDGNGCQIGLCGYGNAELEYYSPRNLTITNVPFESGTRALAIQARRERQGSNEFTSGKIDSYNKVQVKYGMVEIRMSTPDLTTGLWPAAWMLGTSPQAWPRKGEIDIMEMGHKASEWSQSGASSANHFVGANVITWNQAACVPGNETCAASTAWKTKNWYVPATPLVNRFVKYRLYWTDTEMRFTVEDNGVEHDMYDKPLPVNSDALKAPFYLLLNMAVGGNFTDAATPSDVTAPLPSTMYVDYVRVYELDGQGEVKLGNQTVPELGKFGVYTDNSAVNAKLEAGTTSDIWVWNNNSIGGGSLGPYEGNNVLAWSYNKPGDWFGASIQSRSVRDMTNFRNGTVKFRIKIPANVSFNIGLADTYTNVNWLNFPANTTTFGLVRNGDWATATIPVSTLAGPLVALQSVVDMFMFSSDGNNIPTTAFQFAIDDIVWDSGTAAQSGPQYVTQVAPTTIQFTSTVGEWTDLHYTVNDGDPMNVRMRLQNGVSTFEASGLKAGDVVRYNFTYWDAAANHAVDTVQQTYTMR
ncbi:family 16 glycosylhydrolase [Pseudoduganella plicata]|uniref:Endo-1,3-beta-glucanase n=1 Tax=Pseudoduganella plicata TaxID=321984 RepID=A0A4P7BJ72_9BURK|nr:glycoside hydrolase family 16 protein [Pseudoduganella plicata]QBQ37579.1 glycoside hydrolase family 16 protein [Pseudoduganella plicata]GGY91452.1 endo-1,3-beta-glucanase [Pseudoduganella plicata]